MAGFLVGASSQGGVGGCAGEQALVDDPGGGRDATAYEVDLEAGGLVDGGGLGYRDEQHVGVEGVA